MLRPGPGKRLSKDQLGLFLRHFFIIKCCEHRPKQINNAFTFSTLNGFLLLGSLKNAVSFLSFKSGTGSASSWRNINSPKFNCPGVNPTLCAFPFPVSLQIFP